MLRAKEEEEMKRIGGPAYSCWRNVTTGKDIPLVNSYKTQFWQRPFEEE